MASLPGAHAFIIAQINMVTDVKNVEECMSHR